MIVPHHEAYDVVGSFEIAHPGNGPAVHNSYMEESHFAAETSAFGSEKPEVLSS